MVEPDAGSTSIRLAFVFSLPTSKPGKLDYDEAVVREIGAFEAKNTLGALLDLVQQGEEVVITRHGKPVARLVRERDRGDARERARRAADTIAQLSQGVTLGGHSIKALIDEGRP